RELLRHLEDDVDRSVEHQAMFALLRAKPTSLLLEALRNAGKPALRRRALMILDQLPGSPLVAADVLPLLDSSDLELARIAATVASKHKDWMPDVSEHFSSKLKNSHASSDLLLLLDVAVKPWLSEPSVRQLASCLAESGDTACQRTAWLLLAA